MGTEYDESPLLTQKETAKHLGLGLTKTVELMKRNEHTWVVSIGRRKYAHKELLDQWLKGQARK